MGIIFLNSDEHLSDYLEVPDIPNQCPVCEHTVIPRCLLISDKEYDPSTQIEVKEVVFKCVNRVCNSLFISQYECFAYYSESFTMIPKMISKPKVSNEIKEISPNFLKIYYQAIEADQIGLDSICGVGYRKAIEFLVKDYLKSIETDIYTHKQVEDTSLRNCITQWIENPKIKAVLKRATVLGNDETHYRKVYLDKDIEDLKLLIQLTLHFIDMEITFKKVETEFPL